MVEELIIKKIESVKVGRIPTAAPKLVIMQNEIPSRFFKPIRFGTIGSEK